MVCETTCDHHACSHGDRDDGDVDENENKNANDASVSDHDSYHTDADAGGDAYANSCHPAVCLGTRRV